MHERAFNVFSCVALHKRERYVEETRSAAAAAII